MINRTNTPFADTALRIFLSLFIVTQITSVYCKTLNGKQQSAQPLVKWKPPRHSKNLFETIDATHMCDETQNVKNAYIYCYGRILHAVNYHALYKDSKDFVDMPLQDLPNNTQAAFDRQFPPNMSIADIKKEELQEFINKHFLSPGSELEACKPDGWQEFPDKIMAIQDPHMREWGLALNAIWKTLCRRMISTIANRKEQYSLIYMPHQFIAPGGRFREFYYWDAYWIIKGLMASHMYDMAKQMMRNLALMVDNFGFIPNGGRIYYLRRSQPPLLAPMVYEYYESNHTVTHDDDFVHEMLPILEKELKFWDDRRTVPYVDPVSNAKYVAYRYCADSNVPRPESFKEDMAASVGMTETEQAFFYQSMASAAESGWDFSSRWFRESANLSTIETIEILPVDLNAFMCWNFNVLSNLFSTMAKNAADQEKRTHFRERSRFYQDRRLRMMEMMDDLFYNSTTGAWHDVNMRTGLHNTNFYPSIAIPLFTNCYNDLDLDKSDRLFQLMKDLGLFQFPGGIPTSLVANGQQWDFPNGWSPLNHMIIEGLRKSENPLMQEEGFRLAEKWVYANYKVYKHTQHMWEKYNVNGDTKNPGGGGEYEVQDGFGWSNGVILDLLVNYYDRFSWNEAEPEKNDTKTSNALRPSGINYLSLISVVLLNMLIVFNCRFGNVL